MSDFDIYVRILTELNYVHQDRSVPIARARLQDVLIELRNRAARERGDDLGQETQDTAEAMAFGYAHA